MTVEKLDGVTKQEKEKDTLDTLDTLLLRYQISVVFRVEK